MDYFAQQFMSTTERHRKVIYAQGASGWPHTSQFCRAQLKSSKACLNAGLLRANRQSWASSQSSSPHLRK